MDLVGKIIGNRYEILEKIGVGGMATVYKAKCHVLNRYVAIKVLKDEFTTDDEFIRRFNTEAQSAASLSHSNIVSIYDVANEGNLYYIVMELVKGKTLKQIINEDGALPWKWSVNIAIQIASALETAHKNNIVHRDVKPHNIIITEDGIAKVTDFGIAKAVSNSTITAFGTTIGSVHYFSPEHARGGFTDAKSDIYSLGIVMYEMLTGRVPFDADTAVSVALKHMQEKPVEPIKLNPSIPFAVNRIIMKAIQKEVGLRYQSATEMIKDLTMALKNPEGDFVEGDLLEDGATQIISTLHLEEEAEKQEASNSKKGKKKGKMARFFEEHPKAKVPVIILSFILIFVLTLVITYSVVTIISTASKVKDVYIPNLVGMTNEQAKKTAEDSKIIYEVSGEEYSAEYEAGMVISQEPRFIENFRIKEKSTIKVVISKGTEKTTVPSALEGKTFEEVEEKLREANLRAEKVEEKSTKIEEGKVIRVEPDEKKEVNAGDTVQVFVSIGTGIPKVRVDSVIGKPEADAKKILTEKKLEVNVENGEDNTKENGVVLKQSIESGTEVEEGTKITITVNKIAKLVDGTVNINLKSITGYTPPKPTNTTNATNTTGSTVTEEKAKVKVTVTSGDGSVKVFEDKSYSKATENITVKISGIGNVKVEVSVDGVVRGQKQQNIEKEPIFNFN